MAADETLMPMMTALAETIGSTFNKDVMPPHTGFVLLVFPFGAGGTNISYISNAQRDSVVLALKEFLRTTEIMDSTPANEAIN